MTQYYSGDEYTWDGTPIPTTSESYSDLTCPNDGAQIDFPAMHMPGAGFGEGQVHRMRGHCPGCGTRYQLEINDGGPDYLRQAQADGYLQVIRTV